ncbi:MAG: RHS repeat-associated core domain-containing protein, partial [Desulfovibrionaceae bacterium]|nr:RHS repeat-associated core domain-containing protein [Desulfovibrionaceae bacterium]
DPLGDAGGDPDWYGYCLDDPVNGVDPLGLEGGFWDGLKKIGAGFGKLWDTAPAGIGEAMSKGADGAGEAIGKTVDAFKTNEDLQKYTAVALGAGALPIAAAGAAQVAPAVMTTAMRHPDKVAIGTDFVSGFFDPGPPPLTRGGLAGYLATKGREELQK